MMIRMLITAGLLALAADAATPTRGHVLVLPTGHEDEPLAMRLHRAMAARVTEQLDQSEAERRARFR